MIFILFLEIHTFASKNPCNFRAWSASSRVPFVYPLIFAFLLRQLIKTQHACGIQLLIGSQSASAATVS